MTDRAPMSAWAAGSLFNMHEMRAGVFRVRAFDDGFWRIECLSAGHTLTVRSRRHEAPSTLLGAQLEAEDVLRNLAADVASVFGGAP